MLKLQNYVEERNIFSFIFIYLNLYLLLVYKSSRS